MTTAAATPTTATTTDLPTRGHCIMSTDRLLPLPSGYDPATQHAVGLFAAQLDDQSRRLLEAVAGYPVAALEWQPGPGNNTTGMLLAHMAIAEAYWMTVAAAGMRYDPEGVAHLHALFGIHPDDDGFPAKGRSGHPATLAGRTLEFYVDLLARARSATHSVLRGWTDASLAETYVTTFSGRTCSRGWTVYHVLEHFCGHFGQVLLLRHLMRDAGVLPAGEPEA